MEPDLSDFRLGQQAAFSAIESWSKIRHPNIVPVREAFTTRAFGDSCESLRSRVSRPQ